MDGSGRRRWRAGESRLGRAATGARPLARGLIDAVVPTRCPGCGAWDTRLCPSCSGLAWRSPEGRALDDAIGAHLEVLALGAYEGPLRRLVLAAKHDPRLDLTRFLRTAGATLGRAAAAGLGGTEIWVVPAPSGWRRRLSGRMVVRPIAEGVAGALAAELRRPARVVEAVVLRPRAGSQSGRSGAARRAGRRGAMRARVRPPEGVGVVLADDVMTTGATLQEMARVLGPSARTAVALAAVGAGRAREREATAR